MEFPPKIKSVAIWRASIFLTLFSGCGQNQIITPNDGAVVFRDDFSGILSEGWVLDGTNVDVSVSERDGFLTLYPPASIPQGEQAAATVLLRPLSGDFVIITKLDFQTLTDLQSSGFVVRGTDGRTVLLGLTEIGQVGFRGVLMVTDRGPGTQRGRALVRTNLESIYLRLARTGDSFSGSFSTDGVTFTAVGTLANDLSNDVNVGVGTLIALACSSNCDAHVPAEFDFFEVRNPGP